MSENAASYSGKLANALAKLYRLGGMLLVFTFLGALFTLAGAGSLFGGRHSGAMVSVGAVLTFACLLLYAVPQISMRAASRRGRDFAEQVAGHWWEAVTPAHGTALSWVSIRVQPLTGALQLRGRAFDMQGAEFATWDSLASCVDSEAQNLYYQWTGSLLTDPTKTFEGFGKIRLHVSQKGIETGDGFFFDYLVGATDLVIKSTRLRRSKETKEAEIMASGSREARSALVQKVLQDF